MSREWPTKSDRDWINPLRDWSTDPEEVANTITHGTGFLLSLVGALVMAVEVVRGGDAWRIVGCLVYAFSLVAVYAMSTLSHVCADVHRKHFYRRLDQGFIYLLIVGTYTPFSLAFLRNGLGWLFLAVMWSVAIFGFLRKTLHAHRVDTVSTRLYLLLGWMPIFAGFALAGVVPDA
ncbi:MAG: hypothetical protein GTO26_08110, partial [Planctomycetales bacterium]|nr:hypothetical protein [Planctomycetales bacterium]